MDSPIRPLTRAQALRRGYTDKQLWGPRFQRLFQGVYLPAGEPVTVLQRARAALMIAPDGTYASHHTAAALWGAVAPETRDTHITVPEPGLTRSIRQGIAAHRADPRFRAVAHRGLSVASPATVFLQMAAVAPDLVELVVLGDSLVRAGRTTPEDLVEVTKAWDGKGARRAVGRPRWSGAGSTPRWRAGCGCSSCSRAIPSRWSTRSSVGRTVTGTPPRPQLSASQARPGVRRLAAPPRSRAVEQRPQAP
jgi:hypothetical protein